MIESSEKQIILDFIIQKNLLFTSNKEFDINRQRVHLPNTDGLNFIEFRLIVSFDVVPLLIIVDD